MSVKLNLQSVNQRIVRCRRCPRLREYCQQVAIEKIARHRDRPYWGKPVPNFLPEETTGASSARLLIVGLAPGAHGANRTGRMFTGDRSGDFLFAALHRAGLCNQSESIAEGDGLSLNNTVITSAVHCAPPGNKPSVEELDHCVSHFEQTFDAMPKLRVVLTLGSIAHRAVLGLYLRRGWIDRMSRFSFAHAATYGFDNAPMLVCSYHPSQQNTFTGRLTPDMLFRVLNNAREYAFDTP